MCKVSSAIKRINGLSPDQRFETAQSHVSRAIDELLHWLYVRENNKVAVFSPTLSKQIPHSYAARAFNVFRESLYRYEILKLCTFWDKASIDRISIPTICALLDDAKVIQLVGENAYRSASSAGYWMADGADDAIINLLERSALKRAREAQAKTLEDVRSIIDEVRATAGDEKIISLRHFRDHKLAHTLDLGTKDKATPVVRYGYENAVFEVTKRILLKLHLVVNLTDFVFEESRRMAQESAEQLWNNCKFTISEHRKRADTGS